MVSRELTKEEIIHILFFLEEIDRGTFGIIKKVNSNTCIKLYYKNFLNTYISSDIEKIDDEIEQLIQINELLLDNTDAQKERINECKKLEYLYNIGLVKRILTYKGYMIGIEMEYYENYLSLNKARDFLNKEDYTLILKKIRTILDDLIGHNIYPQDISRSNILINVQTLDIVFIDLDDPYTRYVDETCLDNDSLLKKSLIDRCNHRYKEIERYINH